MKGMFENLTVRKNRDDAVFDSNLSESLLGAGDATEDDTGRTGYAPPVLDGDRPEVSGKLKLKIKVPHGRRGGQVVNARLPGRRTPCRLVIPNGLGPGDHFQISIPHVRRGSTPRTPINNAFANSTTNNHGDTPPVLDAETEAFIAALPEEMRDQVRQERAAQAAMLGEMSSTQRQEHFTSQNIFSFTVPQGVTPGSTVQTQGPNGESVLVYIPEGVEAGEVIGVPLPS